jgi:hypothetical protein
MQQAILKNVRGRGRNKKVGMFNRFEQPCRKYIKVRAKQLKISQIQFIQNSVAMAGPDMPRKFKYTWNANGKKAGQARARA